MTYSSTSKTIKLKKETILKYSDYIIIIFLSLQVISISFSIALSSISFGIWAGLWILQIIFTQKFGISKVMIKEVKIIGIFILLFFIIDLFSRIFAVIPDGALIGSKRFLLYFIFFGMISKVKTRDILKKIIIFTLFVFTLISIYEIILYIIKFPEESKYFSTGDIRLYSFAFYITTGELKMLLFLTFFPFVLLKGKTFIPKSYLIPALSVIFISMYLTQSRNVLLAVFICLIIYGIVLNRKFLIYFVAFGAIIMFLIPSQFRQRITSIADPNHPTNASRLVMWNVGWEMFKDHPLIGIGDNEITRVYKMYKIPEVHGEGSHLHSNYFMILATNGILGILTYMFLFITLFLKQIKYFREASNKNDKFLIFGCVLAFISFHISGIFEWNYGDWEVLTLFLFVIAIPFILRNFEIEKNTIKVY